MLRRLNPDHDEKLFREVFSWDKQNPEWYRQMDSVFGPKDVDDFLLTTHDPMNVFVGIFDPELVGVIIVVYVGSQQYNSHLCAKRGADWKVLAQGAYQVIHDFLKMGMVEGFCYVAEKNRVVRMLCDNIGMKHEGVVMYHGTYRGRLIKWLKYSVKQDVKETEVAA